jgi:hypothetical protein
MDIARVLVMVRATVVVIAMATIDIRSHYYENL